MASLNFGLYTKVKMVAKYRCLQCGKKWKSKNSSGGPKQCDLCFGPFIKPYKYRPMKDKEKEKPRRMFGKYNCSCGNSWASGNTWVGMWQKCRDCDAEVMPEDIRPLRYNGGNSSQGPHESSLCQLCLKLGYSCRNYVAPAEDPEEDDDDDVSVISDASTTSSSSFPDDQQLSDNNTPVASDEEDLEEFLEAKISAKMKDMDLNKK